MKLRRRQLVRVMSIALMTVSILGLQSPQHRHSPYDECDFGGPGAASCSINGGPGMGGCSVTCALYLGEYACCSDRFPAQTCYCVFAE